MRIDMKKDKNNPASSMLDQIRKEMERRKPATIDEANRIAKDVTRTYNNTVQPDMGGCSPEQAFILTQPGWMDRALILNDRLTLEELAGAELLTNARVLLLALHELGPVKTTATGSFNRKFAGRMFEEFSIRPHEKEFIASYHKVLNQGDVPYLEQLRYLLPMAGLLLFRKGEFSLTKRGTILLANDKAGELYTLLFQTLLIKFNLAMLDGMPESPIVQSHFGFGLYQVARRADDWIDLADLSPKLFLPALLQSMVPRSQIDKPVDSYAYLRIMRPLYTLGLMEFELESFWGWAKRVCKTELFDKFIGFKLPGAVG